MNPHPRDDFESALRRDAALARQRATPSDDLAQRIVRDVHHSRVAAAQPARSSWRLPLFAFAGLAACAALAFLVLNSDSSTPAAPDRAQDRIATAAPAPSDTARPLTETWAALKPEAQALLARDPLQAEVNAVVSDARSALQFLALNFLPSPTAIPESQSG